MLKLQMASPLISVILVLWPVMGKKCDIQVTTDYLPQFFHVSIYFGHLSVTI